MRKKKRLKKIKKRDEKKIPKKDENARKKSQKNRYVTKQKIATFYKKRRKERKKVGFFKHKNFFGFCFCLLYSSLLSALAKKQTNKFESPTKKCT